MFCICFLKNSSSTHFVEQVVRLWAGEKGGSGEIKSKIYIEVENFRP